MSPKGKYMGLFRPSGGLFGILSALEFLQLQNKGNVHSCKTETQSPLGLY